MTVCDAADAECVPETCDPSATTDGSCVDSSPEEPHVPTESTPALNPIVFGFVLAPLLDILGGYWNQSEWGDLTTPLYDDWHNLYETEYFLGITCFALTSLSIGLFSLAPAVFTLVQQVVIGLHILSEAYLLNSVHSAASAVGWGSTNGKSYFVHSVGLLTALVVEAGLILMPATKTEEVTAEEPVDNNGDNTTEGGETAPCDATTDPTCAPAPAAL